MSHAHHKIAMLTAGGLAPCLSSAVGGLIPGTLFGLAVRLGQCLGLVVFETVMGGIVLGGQAVSAGQIDDDKP